MDESNQIILNDLTLALEVMGKIFAGLFLTPDAFAIYIVFGLGFLLFWFKPNSQH
jgi:hypothetical protein